MKRKIIVACGGAVATSTMAAEEINFRLAEISKGKISLSHSFAKEGKSLPNQRRL